MAVACLGAHDHGLHAAALGCSPGLSHCFLGDFPGAGSYADMNVYVAEYSLTGAINRVKKLPKVKHSSSLPLTSAKEVSEKEFVVLGLLKNSYGETVFAFDDGVIDVRPLETVAGLAVKVFSEREPETKEAKKLVWFAKKLKEQTSKKDKKNICYSYLSWAEKEIEEFEEENEDI